MKTLKSHLLATAVVAGSVAFALPAFAQIAADTAQAAPAEGSGAEQPDVVVTGSRIASPNIVSVAPIQSTTVEQINDAGVTNIQELLLENPAFGAPTFARTNTAFLTSGTGIASIDLRNLGTNRTLVLVNGRRVVSGIPGSATVDLNVIPQQFIERVDTLTGGSSSLYGSDAVAGVVNFIYKTNFEGLEANAQYGITERGDDARYQANITAGGNFADDRGNMMVHFGYSNERGVLSRQRSNTRVDDLDTFWGVTGDPADYGVVSEPRLSGFAPQGSFNAGGYNFTFSPTGQLQPCFTTNGAACNSLATDPNGNVIRPSIGTGVGPNGFNRQAFRTIAVPVERYLFASRGHYDITDGIRFFAEGTYNRTSSSREIEPFALASNGVGGIYPNTGGAVPLQTLVNGALVRNPFVPDAIFNAATDTNGDGIRDIQFSRRISEFGTRNGSTNRDFYRFVLGLEGNLAGDRFRWDVSYNYGRTSESQQSNGQVNVLNFRNALSAIPGENGTPICADAAARAQGCVPINIYGLNSISPAAVAYIAADQTLQTRISQQQVQGNLSGTLVDLPAGPLGVAIGAEYRRESSFENNDALTNAGLNAGNALPDTSGAFDVKEVYGEINVPLLSDTTFFQDLSLRAAGRISDYSTVGTIYTWNAGGDWSPVRGLRVRGTYARSVRAPNIGELFQGPAQTFPTGLVDPCIGVTATGGGALGDNCRAAPGVLENIAANGAFVSTQLDNQGISGFNSGNANLNEEKSTSYTIGAVLTAGDFGVGGVFSRLNLSVDYFNIRITDVITAAPRQFTLNQCYENNNSEFCQLVQRRAAATSVNSAGSIELINAPGINGGELFTDGIDAVLNWSAPVSFGGDGGTLGLRVSYTHLFEGYLIPLPGAGRDYFAGEIGAAKDRFTSSLFFQNKDFRVNFTGTYIGKSYEDDLSLASYDVGRFDVSVPSEFYLDSQVTFKAATNYDFYFGVDNLLDNKAPNILSGSPFNVTGTDTAAGVYDVFGRRFYAGARLRF